MFQFISFGSGSSGNCYLLSYQNESDLLARRTTILIDAGVGIRTLQSSMNRYGYSLPAVDALLLTHDHSDHARNAAKLNGKYGMEVYATEKTFDGIRRNPTIKSVPVVAEKCLVQYCQMFRIGDFSITAYPVCHDSMDCVAYKIEVGGKIFTLITDCGEISMELGHLISASNYLVLESNHDVGMLRGGRYPVWLQRRVEGSHGHLSNEACAAALEQYLSNDIENVFLCHLSAENNREALALETSACIVSRFKNASLVVLPRRTVELFDLSF